MEEELVCLRLCQEGKVEVQFVGIQAIDKADAETITEAIHSMTHLSTGGDVQEKLVAVATDGASMMMGSKTELVSKLHGNKFYMLGIHCMARCLELAFKYTVKASTFEQGQPQ
jgi:hypothetical protein